MSATKEYIDTILSQGASRADVESPGAAYSEFLRLFMNIMTLKDPAALPTFAHLKRREVKIVTKAMADITRRPTPLKVIIFYSWLKAKLAVNGKRFEDCLTAIPHFNKTQHIVERETIKKKK